MSGHAARGGDALSVLLLCDDSSAHAPNVLEHIRALRRFSRHRVDVFNPVGINRTRLLRFDDYDVVVVHYTVTVLYDSYLSPWFREQLAGFSGLKVQFIQDEYRWVDAMTARIRELGVDLLFSSIPVDVVPQVYGPRLPGVDVLPTLTGYVPAELEGARRLPLDKRSLDVGYRGRSIPYWLGRLGQDKVVIGREFLARAASTDLRCDILWTEADRIYGQAWYRFLGSSRTTLGTESGASIVDFDGTVQERVQRYVGEHPAATFEEVERGVLAPFEGNAVIDVVSPRVFEAAALGTAMVNFTGRYSGVISPWVHYIPLEKDYSNFDEVVAAIRDEALLERITSKAHEDLVASDEYSLGHFVREFDREIEARARPAPRRRRSRLSSPLSQKLVQLEQLAAPARRSELPLLRALRARATKRTVDDLLGCFPEIAALAPKPASPRLRDDLVRLAAATAAHLRELRHDGPSFDVRLELDDETGRLTLLSRATPSQAPPERAAVHARIASLIRDGRLREVVWNHAPIGVELDFPVAVVWTVPVRIGYHVVDGVHNFTSLAGLAKKNPEGVIAALEPLCRARPEAPVHELQGPPAAVRRIVSTSGPKTLLGVASLRAVLTSKELRRLLAAYLASAEAREEAAVAAVLRDFFRLRLVGGLSTDVALDEHQRTLVFRTSPSGSGNGVLLDPAIVESLEQIVWDHSSAGTSVDVEERPRVSVTLEGGVYEFQALTVVARRFPELAAQALRRAASG